VNNAPQNKVLWPMLIEKGLAKAFGSYYGINEGTINDAIGILTGLYTKTVYFHFPNKTRNPKLDGGVLFEELAVANEAGLLMCAGSAQPGGELSGRGDSHDIEGIRLGHAYSIHAVKHFTKGEVSTQEERLVQLRNPWGNWEYTGKFSDFWLRDSSEGKSYKKEALKAKLDWADDHGGNVNMSDREDPGLLSNDGLFWMSWEDFTSESFFDSVTVCHHFAPESYIKKSLTSAWARPDNGGNGGYLGCYPTLPWPSKSLYPNSSERNVAKKEWWDTFRRNMMYSPQFRVSVSHVGSLYIEVMSSSDHNMNEPRFSLMVYDWQNDNGYDLIPEQEGIMAGGERIAAESNPDKQYGFSKQRAAQCEICGKGMPLPNHRYTIASHIWDPPADKDGDPSPLEFTVTAWFKPYKSVSLKDAYLDLEYQDMSGYTFLGPSGRQERVWDVDLRHLKPYRTEA